MYFKFCIWNSVLIWWNDWSQGSIVQINRSSDLYMASLQCYSTNLVWIVIVGFYWTNIFNSLLESIWSSFLIKITRHSLGLYIPDIHCTCIYIHMYIYIYIYMYRVSQKKDIILIVNNCFRFQDTFKLFQTFT